MSRSGYSEDLDNWSMIRWAGQVASAIRGKRGQAFLRELIAALDAMPKKRLINDALIENGEVCALGALGLKRGIPLDTDPDDYDTLASDFGIAHQLVQEIEFRNDEDFRYVTPEKRWELMLGWAKQQLRPEKSA